MTFHQRKYTNDQAFKKMFNIIIQYENTNQKYNEILLYTQQVGHIKKKKKGRKELAMMSKNFNPPTLLGKT